MNFDYYKIFLNKNQENKKAWNMDMMELIQLHIMDFYFIICQILILLAKQEFKMEK